MFDFFVVVHVVFILTSTICTQESMNINVWIITKICKALNQSFGETCCCFVLAFHNNPTSTFALSHKPGEEGGLFCQQFLCTNKFFKVPQSAFSVSRGLPRFLGFPSFAPLLRVWCLHRSYRKQKKNSPSAPRSSRLATNLHPPSVVSERRRH